MPTQRRIKGIKGQPNTPLTEYGELKANVKMTLTPTCRDNLDAAAEALNLSRSELVERLGRKGKAWLINAVKKKSR